MNRIQLAWGVFAVAVGVASAAAALPLNAHGSGTFLASLGSQQADINRSSAGVSNTAAASRFVYANPSRNPHAAGNQTVGWTGWSNAVGNNNCCSVFSINSGGVALASKSSCVTGVSGYYITSVSFTVAEAPPDASYVLYCTLLASSANRVHSYRVSP
jgi:hypothetical protein